MKSSAIQISNGGSPSIYWSYSPLIVGFSHALIFLLTKLQQKKEYGGYVAQYIKVYNICIGNECGNIMTQRLMRLGLISKTR